MFEVLCGLEREREREAEPDGRAASGRGEKVIDCRAVTETKDKEAGHVRGERKSEEEVRETDGS